MIARYVQKGEAIDYRPTEVVAAGDVVVQGDLVGIAKLDIEPGALGAVAVAGVYDVAKESGEINTGSLVYWNVDGKVATTSATGNPYLGKCVTGAEDSDDTVRILLNAPYVAIVEVEESDSESESESTDGEDDEAGGGN